MNQGADAQGSDSLREIVNQHLATEVDLAHISPLIRQLRENGNGAFASTLPEACILIPIAAHQEPAADVARTLGLFAQQMEDPQAPKIQFGAFV